MNIGEKIKIIRKSKGLTQSEVCGDKITRNMLSKIENAAASPSLDTLQYLSDALNVPLSYLCSNDDDLTYYQKKGVINEIYADYAFGKYQSCINKAIGLECIDNELAYILTDCYFKHGMDMMKIGALNSAHQCFVMCEKYSKLTTLDTKHITSMLAPYVAVCKNISSPLLEFDPDAVENELLTGIRYEFLKFLQLDFDYDYKDKAIKLHVKAKSEIKARNYQSAISILLDVVEYLKNSSYDAYQIYSAYSDLEICYKQLFDFENAYLYASKKLSLIEAFKS